MKIYTKPPLNLSEQLAELKKRGLIIDDETSAKQVLSEISYFRFVAYLRPMEANKETHCFKYGATFSNAIALYDFHIFDIENENYTRRYFCTDKD